MMRFVAGVVSALLLAAAGFFLWTGTAGRERDPLPLAPRAAAVDAAEPSEAPAATERTREEKRFARYDKDRDGAVAREEYLAARRKAFARLDADGDGRLSFDEWAAKAEAKFATADADKSGRLDAAEFATTRVVRKAAPRCPPAAAGSDD